ncbi:NAD(P)-binding domain-containing protein [Jiangella mangrovi]|uniref:3-hydroxyisobutyrate dehydrogenase-like beta-hydroxyacid dehydrogenase n=1 Tax=Jiangella mangrovi TaxID=1524084 RepID=A0A7W9LPD9_9ACTN|nr:3-hydroxyisobutyrate dehydrogenase-like beta-hydroxyacid dehydrogenase [Jiangella mangrovi]
MRIAVVGIGLMGRPVAQRLVDAGHEVTVHSRRKESAEEVLAAGASWADSAAAAGDGADLAIAFLPDPDTVEAAVLGPSGLLAAAAPPAVVADMSTSPPELARRLAVAATDRGVEALDAPVSGGPMGAAAGTLTIMAGGSAEAFERARPAFEVLGTPVLIGGPGAGQSVKLVNQLLIGGIAGGIADAWALAGALGLDPEVVADVVGRGLGTGPLLDFMWPRLVRGDLAPGFKVDHMIKDLALAEAAGEEHGLDLAAGRSARERYRWLSDAGGGDLGTQALYRHAVRDRPDAPTAPVAEEDDRP